MNTTTDEKPTTPDEKTIAQKFTTANPIEFDFYNQDDERVLFITDDDKLLQTLNLELRNRSPHEIEFQTPGTTLKPVDLNRKEIGWGKWVAGKDLYHFQLSFRPGVLSDKAKDYLKHPAYRLDALAEGWDLKYDPNAADLTDWVSILWVGEQRGKKFSEALKENPKYLYFTKPETLLKKVNETFKDEMPGSVAGLARQATLKLVLPKLSAGAGGGARGTRIHLNYRHLVYQNLKESVPAGTRAQFLNIVNHQGKQYIPLHVGFVGSNTILNDDGKTPNELKLRITNTSSDPIIFARKSDSNASRFSISFDLEDDHEHKEWALTSKNQAEQIELQQMPTDRKVIAFRRAHWINVEASYLYQKANWTLTAWVLPKKGGSDLHVIYSEGENERRKTALSLAIESNNKLCLYFRKQLTGYEKASGPKLVLGKWNFIWITCRGSAITIGANDQLSKEELPVKKHLASDGAKIGRHFTEETFFNGLMGRVSLWDKVCSKEEIDQIKGYGCGGDEAGLLAYWPMDAIKDGKVKNMKSRAWNEEVVGDPKLTSEKFLPSPQSPDRSTNQATWAFNCVDVVGEQLAGGESFDLNLSHIRSASPTGYANLYFHYEDIPGYWDGQIVCLIEKAPMVFRRVVETDEQKKQEHYDRVGIGTDVPKAKLHVDVVEENKTHTVGKEEIAAVFMGGNVGIGTTAPAATIDVSGNVNIKSAPSGTNTALYVENPSPGADGNTALFVSGVDDRFSHIHHGENGDWYIRSAKTSGKVILQDSGGNVSIGTAEANSKLTVAGGEKQEIVAEFKSSRDAGIMVESGKEKEPYIGFRKQKVTPEDIDSAWMVGIDHEDRFAIAFGVGEITEKREAHMAGTIPWEWRYVPGKKGNEKLTISSAGDVVIRGTLKVKDTIFNQNLRERHEIREGNFNRKILKEFSLACKADILLLVQFDKLRASTEQLATISMIMDNNHNNPITEIDAQLHFHHGGAYAYLSPSLHHLEQNVKAGRHTIELQHSIPTTEFKSCLLTIIQL